MEPIDLAIRIVLIGLSLIMLLVSIQAYRRAGGRRMILVFISFLGFTVLSALVLYGEIVGDDVWNIPNAVVLLLMLIIGANYLSLLRG